MTHESPGLSRLPVIRFGTGHLSVEPPRPLQSRFGWRYAFATHQLGILITPVKSLPILERLQVAECDRHRTPPASSCSCGIHYFGDVIDFVSVELPHFVDVDAGPILRVTMVAVYGEALGAVSQGTDTVDGVRKIMPNRFRATAFRMDYCVVPSGQDQLAAEIANYYRVPVRTTGLNLASYRAILNLREP